jgi:hypothetical protein
MLSSKTELTKETENQLKTGLSQLFNVDARVINILAIDNSEILVTMLTPTLVDSEEMGKKAHSGSFESIFSDAGLQPSKIEINIVHPNPPEFIQQAPYILFIVLAGCLLLVVIYFIRRFYISRADKRERERDNMIRADVIFTEGMAFGPALPLAQPGVLGKHFDAANGECMPCVSFLVYACVSCMCVCVCVCVCACVRVTIAEGIESYTHISLLSTA